MDRLQLEDRLFKVSDDTMRRGLSTMSEKLRHAAGQLIVNTRCTNMFPCLLFEVWKQDRPDDIKYYINSNGFDYSTVYDEILPGTVNKIIEMKAHDEKPGNFYFYLLQAGYDMKSHVNPWKSCAPAAVMIDVERVLFSIPVINTRDLCTWLPAV